MQKKVTTALMCSLFYVTVNRHLTHRAKGRSLFASGFVRVDALQWPGNHTGFSDSSAGTRHLGQSFSQGS